MTNLLLVVLGGLFGFLLSKLPERWVYAIAAAAIALGILLFQGVIE